MVTGYTCPFSFCAEMNVWIFLKWLLFCNLFFYFIACHYMALIIDLVGYSIFHYLNTLLKKCKICTSIITSQCTFLDDRIVGFVFLKCKLLSFPLERMCYFALPPTICECLFLHPRKRQHLKDFYRITFGPFLFFSPMKYHYHSPTITF